MVLYVDDCFVDCLNLEALDYIEQKVTEKYGECTPFDGDVLPFVGMPFNFRQPDVKVDMPKYVEDTISGLKLSIPSLTPAGLELFLIEEVTNVLGKIERQEFHSRVAKLLYLANRTRPDILLALKISVHKDCQTNGARLKESYGSLQIFIRDLGSLYISGGR